MLAFDKDIRVAITDRILRFNPDNSTLRLVEELELLSGAARIDMAFFENDILGVEIKGPRDSLARLSEQARVYSRVFDRVIIVAAKRFIERILDEVPIWWGIVEVREVKGRLVFKNIRTATRNPDVEIEAVLELLWKSELVSLLESAAKISPNPRNPRAELRHQILKSTDADEAKALTLAAFKSRANWRHTRFCSAK